MRTWIKKATVVFLLTGVAGLTFGQDIKRPEKESGEMKRLRQRGEQLRIDRIKLAVKKDVIKSDKAAFMIKRIKFMSEFKNNNPQWVKYGRRFARGMMGRRGNGRKGRHGMMRGKRMGSRDGRMGRRGHRGGDQRSVMRNKRRYFWKNLTTETAEMKNLRHQRRDLQISRIKFAVKQGFADAGRAAFRIKRIKATHGFKDSNPGWVKYRRGYAHKGGRGNMKQRSGRGRRGR